MPVSLRRLLFLCLLPGFVAALISACALNPVSGGRELALMSEAQEIELGRKNDVEIRKQYGVVSDQRLQAYVQHVGERLAARSHRPQLQYHFTVLDSADVNAFALPGGYVYVTRGILAHLDSEAEMAAVLGHEIGHVTARHAVRQYSAAVAANIGFTLGSIFVPELGSQAGQSLFNVIGGALLSGYGREHELEADRLGAEYIARTDYDPKAMIDVISLLKNQEVFERTLAAKEGRKPRVYHGVFASHPGADQRLQQVVGEAEKHRSVTNGRVEHDAYLHLLDGLAWGDSEAQGIRRGSNFYHQGLGFALRFPTGWHIDNTPERLVAVGPANDALIEVRTAEHGAVATPRDYLLDTMKLRDLRSGATLRIDGMDGYSGVSRLQTPFGVRDAEVAAVFLHRQAFTFFGAARTPTPETRRAFLATVQSLHALKPEEQALARSLRIDVITARSGDSFASLARRSHLTNEPEATLRLLNGKYPQGQPVPGELVKILQ